MRLMILFSLLIVISCNANANSKFRFENSKVDSRGDNGFKIAAEKNRRMHLLPLNSLPVKQEIEQFLEKERRIWFFENLRFKNHELIKPMILS